MESGERSVDTILDTSRRKKGEHMSANEALMIVGGICLACVIAFIVIGFRIVRRSGEK